MSTFAQVAASVCSGIPEVVRRLEPFAREAPWKHLDGARRTSTLPELARLACELALLEPASEGSCRRMLECAGSHGHTRRQQGLPEFILLNEMAVVRQGIWVNLQARHGDSGSVVAEVILRIDRALTLASQASLRGYFRPEFENQGNWPAAILLLEREWTTPIEPREYFRDVVERGLRRKARPACSPRRYHLGRSGQVVEQPRSAS